MSNSNRGAAQVSLMWAISLLVVALVSIFLAYSANSKITVLEGELATSKAEVTRFTGVANGLRDQIMDIGVQVGWQPSSTEGPRLDGVKSAITELGANFPSVDPTAASLEAIQAGLITDYTASQSRVADLERQVDQLRGDLDARQSENDTAIAQKDQTIATLRSENQDLTNNLNGQIVDLERQRDGLRDQYRDLDTRLQQTVDQKDAEIVLAIQGTASMKLRNDVLSDRLNRVARRAEMPDGSVLTANANIGKAWIDLGRRDRVNPGLTFEVLDRVSGLAKGHLTVLSIEEERAECRVTDLLDRYNPISSDDLVRNAMFDPGRRPVAVLLGNGYGRYNASDMKAKLAEVGISVVEELSYEVDYLLLGTPFFDEETGDMVPWESQDNYKVAQGLSVEVVPRRDWLTWLGL